VPAKAAPHFKVEKYFVMGNTLLPPETIGQILAHVPGAYGTNVSLDGIRAAVKGLQSAYSVRGYVTVAVGLPPQKITNATVKIQVTEGRLASIEVKGNHYFSSNNVMRSLPGLHMNMILNGLTFQAQLNQANANQDRQIYPKVQPGPDPGTTDLRLDVVDRFPLHAKVDFNNESSPGTPDLRVNSSVVYDNLWQQDQSLGVQYSFSPELYKAGSQWDWYDQPLVANSSTFYRIPLGRPTSVDDEVESNPGTFGYDEATRKFNLPPSSGRPELSFFASRSTIDTGLTTSPGQELYNTNGSVLTLTSESQSLTVNNDIGFRLSLPEVTPSGFHSDFSGGLDYKNYSLFTGKTNVYTLQTTIIDTLGGSPQTNINTSTDTSPVGVTENSLDYVPLQLRYDGTWHDALGPGSIGLGLGVNLWYDAQTSQGVNTNITALQGLKALRNIAGSTNTLGHWVVLNPSFSHQLELVPNWLTTIRADGQWASEPLISNEQFGAGGVNSVRGYQEGQVFGDTGWHVSLEQQTPAHMVGYVRGGVPLMIRGSIYTDYADTYLLDPQGRPDNTALWGTGFGAVALVGSHWEARFLFSVPMLGTASVEAYQPFFNFALTAQF
jgi:hemolysin activation/secretion protein